MNLAFTLPAMTLRSNGQERNYDLNCSTRGTRTYHPTGISRREFFGWWTGPVLSAACLAIPWKERNPASAAELTEREREEALAELARVTELQNIAFEYTSKGQYEKADAIWTRLIGMKKDNPAAYSNRGNCRVSMGHFEEAMEDYDRAIALAPEEPDPFLGRGVAKEGLRRFEEALVDYGVAEEKWKAKFGQEDAFAVGNQASALSGLGRWEESLRLYQRASALNKQDVSARTNEALVMYQIGRDRDKAERELKFLTRKYPSFADGHAALAAMLWGRGDRVEAETQFARAVSIDPRYEDVEWVRDSRRWPPALVEQLRRFSTFK